MLWWSWWLWWLWSRWCQYVDTWEQWWWLPMRSHSAPPSPWSGWTGTPEVCRRWRWWCWKYSIDGQDFVQYFASVMNRDICHGRNHQMALSLYLFFHLLTIRRSAKAVFCDRRHLLKFSLQQDLWTKIITNFVFQSFRLCSRTALQVLSTDYTVTIVAEKLERGGFCFCLGSFVYSSTSNVDLNNHTGHIYRTGCTDMQKNISAQV